MVQQERPYHHGNLRNEIVRVGLELITEGGTEAVGIRETARRLGVSASAAYRHFESRAELLDAVRDAVLVNVADQLQEALDDHAESDVATRLETISRAYFQFSIDNPKQFQALAAAFPLAEDWQTAPGRPLRILTSIIDDIEPSVDDALTSSLAAWAIVQGASSLTTLGSLRELPVDEKWKVQQRTTEILLKGLGLR